MADARNKWRKWEREERHRQRWAEEKRRPPTPPPPRCPCGARNTDKSIWALPGGLFRCSACLPPDYADIGARDPLRDAPVMITILERQEPDGRLVLTTTDPDMAACAEAAAMMRAALPVTYWTGQREEAAAGAVMAVERSPSGARIIIQPVRVVTLQAKEQL